jgi:hypothetical protein
MNYYKQDLTGVAKAPNQSPGQDSQLNMRKIIRGSLVFWQTAIAVNGILCGCELSY